MKLRRSRRVSRVRKFISLHVQPLEERALLAAVNASSAQGINVDLQIVDINSGAAGSGEYFYPPAIQAVNGTAYFAANGGTKGSGLWKTNGTPAGTEIVKAGVTPCEAEGCMANVNGTLYFLSNAGTGFPYELWKSNGTAAGTVLLKVLPGNEATLMGNVGDTVFVRVADNTTGDSLWRSDGTPAGTILISEINLAPKIPNFQRDIFSLGVNYHGRFFFAANDGAHGHELWTSDGTPSGTTMFQDINPGISGGLTLYSGTTTYFTESNGALFFQGFNGLWKTDGTVAGTLLVKQGVGSFSKIDANGTLIFFPDGVSPWKSDGTESGTVLLKTLVYGDNNFPPPPVNVNGTIFFTASDGVHGDELWKTDGTTAGTVMVKNINLTVPGIKEHGSEPTSVTNIKGNIFFIADDGVHGTELWQSDGTEVGTTLVKDIYPGLNVNLFPASSGLAGLTNVSGRVVFTADDGTHGRELWIATPLNTGAPFASDKLVTAVKETPLPVTLKATDIDNDPLTYTIVSQPQHGTLSGTAPILTYTSHANYTGPDSFTFRANDGQQDSNVATVAITVISNAPVAYDFVAVTKGSKPVNVALAAADPRNLPLTYTVTSGPLHGALSGTAPNLIYTATAGYVGPDSFAFQANNGQSASNIATVTINVTPNHAPTIPGGPLLWAPTKIPITLTADDQDDDLLTYTVLTLPKFGQVTGTVPNLFYTPAAGNEIVSLTYQASDGEALSNIGTIDILILNIGIRVIAEDGMHTEVEFAQKLYADVPPGGDPNIAFSTTSSATNLFSAQPAIDSTGKLTFTPAPNSQGTAIVTVVKKNVVAGAAFEGEETPGETAEFVIEIVQQAPWQNDVDPNDVNNDGDVVPEDVLLVIDHINAVGSGEISNTNSNGPFYDANGDNYLTAGDVLDIINWINADDSDAEGEFGGVGAEVRRLAGGPVGQASSGADVAGQSSGGTGIELDWLNCLASDVAGQAGEVAGQPRRGRI